MTYDRQTENAASEGTSASPCSIPLRDWFAGQALCGMMACSYTVEHGDDPANKDVGIWPATRDRVGEADELAQEAYRAADAMLRKRDK